ncbi:MAG: aldo/keto reductase [Propionibacteriaceae bacterium]|jgi:aryl-alcohol dehydrogenase-like predicted oxidoreductase|nr:aldo/keto reductase [Propionibacteriaceae bacterium]
MRTAQVGNTDLRVSRMGLGTMSWGTGTPISEVVPMLSTFIDHGGNLIDTAAAYGQGEVESLIGRILSSTIRRQDLVIATKSGFIVRNGQRVIDNSPRTLLADLEGSLRRLGTDWVDLWQIHAWGEEPLEETLTAADQAVSMGMARHVGVSNFVGWHVARAETWQRALQRTPISSVQAEYSLLARRAELELLPCVSALSLGFFPWSGLGRGVLTGKYISGIPSGSRGDDSSLSWFVEQYFDADSRRIVNAVATAAHGLSLTPAQVALMWVRDAPYVTAPLVGPRDLNQLLPLLATEDLSLPDPIVSALDDVSGGPNQGRSHQS